MLAELLDGAFERILNTEQLEDGPETHECACSRGLEGISSASSGTLPIAPGGWKLKTKRGKRDAFPIVAFVEKLGTKPRRIPSLYVGRREGDRPLYADKVRSGYTEAVARDLREWLDPFVRQDSPLREPVNKPKRPGWSRSSKAEIAYSTVTENNLLREAVFRGAGRMAECRRGILAASREKRPVRLVYQWSSPCVGSTRVGSGLTAL